MSDWARVVNTTTRNYLKGETVNILRNRKLTGLLQSKGRFSFNDGGDDLVWRVRYQRAPMTGYADTESLTFPRRNRWVTASLPWRAYIATDSVTKGEKLKNKSVQQIVSIFDTANSALKEDMTEAFGDEFYQDGNAAGHTKGIHGINSFMGTSATSLAFVATPSDSFANLSTALAAKGGNWTGNWPTGVGDPQYDYWTPIIVDTTDSAWSAATKTFQYNATEQLRYGIMKSRRSKSTTGKLDLIIMNDEMLRYLLTMMEVKERIQIERTAATSLMLKLGYDEIVTFDGVDCTTEFGVPEGEGYGFNTSAMEVRSQQKELFVPDGPDYDISTKSWRFTWDFYGNCRWNPRYFVKWKSYT